MIRVCTLACALMAAGCGSGSGAPPASPTALPNSTRTAPPRPPSPEARSARSCTLVERTLGAVARARGLAPKHSVSCAVVGRHDLVALVKAHVARDVPREAIHAEGVAEKLLGFVPTSMDYEAAAYELLGSEIAGYYEPANGTMYLARDQDEESAASTLSHELVHALQDQFWDLRVRSVYVVGEDDHDGATSALAEGDATSAMEDLVELRAHTGKTALDTPDEVLVERWNESLETSFPRQTPHALKTSLVAPYVDGTAFVNALRRRGGWALVDEAWNNPPTTTEQILHPEKWSAHEAALTVETPPPPPSSPELPRLLANTYGEQGLRLAFAEWMGLTKARTAAAGWGGDRVAIYGDEATGYAMLWHVRFDHASPAQPDAYASRAFDSLAVALPSLGHVSLRTPRALCVERMGNGVIAVLRDGQELLITLGRARGHAAEPWQSAMTCTEASAWSASTVRAAAGRG